MALQVRVQRPDLSAIQHWAAQERPWPGRELLSHLSSSSAPPPAVAREDKRLLAGNWRQTSPIPLSPEKGIVLA